MSSADKEISPMDISEDDAIRRALLTLCDSVREMSATGTKPVPATPDRFNLLARPYKDPCRICGLAGHHSDSVKQSTGCNNALLSLVNFWEDTAAQIDFLRGNSSRFKMAIARSQPTYEMRSNNTPTVGINMESILVDWLTRSYLKYQAHFARVRAKANVIMSPTDVAHHESVSLNLNELLLHGSTLSDLFERSNIANEQQSSPDSA